MKSAKAFAGLDKCGAVGAMVVAAAAPCCFPLLATLGGALGLSVLAPWRGYVDWAIQGFAMLALVGNGLAFRQHRRVLPLGIGLMGAAMVFAAFQFIYQVSLVYAGLGSLGTAAVWNHVAKRRAGARGCAPELRSTITCPHCGHLKTETMPSDACVYFYECTQCHATLRPRPGDCCVFCSYGAIRCPPKQLENGCGPGAACAGREAPRAFPETTRA